MEPELKGQVSSPASAERINRCNYVSGGYSSLARGQMKMMNRSLTVWHFARLVCRPWDDAVGLPAFQKQLIFSGTALRSLPGGGLVSAGRGEHIDWCFIVRG